LPGWRMLPDKATPVAICTAHAETARAAADRFGIPRAYSSFDEMLADPDIDIVSLGARPPVRAPMTAAALAANKHVFSCIPFAMSVADAEQLAATQRARKLVGALDAYFMWTPAYGYFADLLRDGLLGPLTAVNVNFSMAQNLMPAADYPYRWTGSAENGAGVGPNACAHVFHTLIALFGPITEVIGETRQAIFEWRFADGETQTLDVPDTASVLARFENGAIATIHAGRAVPSATGLAIEAYGAKGRITAHSPAYPLDRSVTLTSGAPAPLFERREQSLIVPERYFAVPGGRTTRPDDAPVAVSMGRLFAHFLNAIDSGSEAAPSFRRGAYVQRLVAAVDRSMQTRRWESVEAAA
jgi:predicted dehydrogenase